jgi:hypothetical protein
MRKYRDYIDYTVISKYQILSEKFIYDFEDKLDWTMLSKYQKLSEKLMRVFKKRLNWVFISATQDLTESFILEFREYLFWEIVCGEQKISEEFIIKNEDTMIWPEISNNEKISLSEEFIEKYQDKLDCGMMMDSGKATLPYIKRNIHKTKYKHSIRRLKNSGLKESELEELRKFIDKSNKFLYLYE